MNQVEFEAVYPRIRASKPTNVPVESRPRGVVGFLRSTATGFLPILDWLPNYVWRENLHGDLVAGITVGIMVVPQGMAYANLAGVPPVYGLYSCFFAAFVYMFFGTSRHVSIGTFAVSSMMVGALVSKVFPKGTVHTVNGTSTTDLAVINFHGRHITALDLTSALSLGVGLAQIIMAVCRLSFLTEYISDALISGFTAGSAFHVFMSQVGKAMGVKTPERDGPGMIFYMIYDDFLAAPKTNFWALGISVLGIVFLLFGKDYINPWFKRRFRVPLPLELFLVIVGTILSKLLNMKENYHVKVVDHVPQGFPAPSIPDVRLLRYIWTDVLGLAVICFMFPFTMGKIFAKKHKYKLDANQELYALGFAASISSLFPVYPTGAALSRSSVCEMAGAKTQVNALFSSVLLLIVILALGPLLEPLPMAVLAAIVMASLKGLFMQFKILPRLWKISRLDFAVWILSFTSTVVTDVQIGLLISVLFNVLSLGLREQWPKIYTLYSRPQKDIFKAEDNYQGLMPLENGYTTILKFEAPLHFGNVSKFTCRLADYFASIELGTIELTRRRTLILECSAVAYIDQMGMEALQEAYGDGKKCAIRVVFADVADSILDAMQVTRFHDSVPKECFYPTLRDAVAATSRQATAGY
ncbi:sulfate permease family protein [Aphelenchoides avenae]|nr:sulfate permease family protein [Aphelenchus avenae]